MSGHRVSVDPFLDALEDELEEREVCAKVEVYIHPLADEWEPYRPNPWLLALIALSGIACWALLGLGVAALWGWLWSAT